MLFIVYRARKRSVAMEREAEVRVFLESLIRQTRIVAAEESRNVEIRLRVLLPQKRKRLYLFSTSPMLERISVLWLISDVGQRYPCYLLSLASEFYGVD